MATPPPAPNRRVHTPPAPRFGPLEDEWTPYTPRRSSRVAAQQQRQVQNGGNASGSGSSVPRMRNSSGRHITSTPSRGTISHQTSQLSPPSSPLLSSAGTAKRLHHTPLRSKKTLAAGGSASKKRQGSPGLASDMELNHHDSLNLGVSDPRAVLPTPSKTPRKRDTMNQEPPTSTSRVLFHPRLASVEDAIPSPKKRSRKSLGAASSSFASVLYEDTADPGQSSKIEVYEDSKDRVPTLDYDDDNPFVVRPSETPKRPLVRTRPQTKREARMEEDTKKDRGVTYVFRGKKIFKRFTDAEEGDDGEEEVEEDSVADLEIIRQAGTTANTKLKRSSLKPKILFPTAAQLKAKEERIAREAAEEALTDVEGDEESEVTIQAGQPGPVLASVPTKSSHTVLENVSASVQLEEPTSQTTSTPSTKIDVSFSTQTSETVSFAGAPAPANKLLQKPKRGGRARSPFDKWGHTKRASASSLPASSKLSAGSKREGSPLEMSSGMGKRARSGAGPSTEESTS